MRKFFLRFTSINMHSTVHILAHPISPESGVLRGDLTVAVQSAERRLQGRRG